MVDGDNDDDDRGGGGYGDGGVGKVLFLLHVSLLTSDHNVSVGLYR